MRACRLSFSPLGKESSPRAQSAEVPNFTDQIEIGLDSEIGLSFRPVTHKSAFAQAHYGVNPIGLPDQHKARANNG